MNDIWDLPFSSRNKTLNKRSSRTRHIFYILEGLAQERPYIEPSNSIEITASPASEMDMQREETGIRWIEEKREVTVAVETRRRCLAGGGNYNIDAAVMASGDDSKKQSRKQTKA